MARRHFKSCLFLKFNSPWHAQENQILTQLSISSFYCLEPVRDAALVADDQRRDDARMGRTLQGGGDSLADGSPDSGEPPGEGVRARIDALRRRLLANVSRGRDVAFEHPGL